MAGGPVDDGGDPFAALFLDQAALPAGMRRVHMVDGVPLLQHGSTSRVVRSGTAIWLAEPDADLYRLDDSRWVMRSRRTSASLFGDLSSQMDNAARLNLSSRLDDARGEADTGTEASFLPDHSPDPGYGPSYDHYRDVPAGHPDRVMSGIPDEGFVYLARVGVVVIRLATTPGEQARIERTLAACLGARAEVRVGAALNARRARPLGGAVRRAPLRLRPDRWRPATRGGVPPERPPEESG